MGGKDGLDPAPLEQEAIRSEAHRLLDNLLDRLFRVRGGRPWRPVERSLKVFFQESLEDEGATPKVVVDALLAKVLVHPPGHAHPRFFGWAIGSGTFEGSLGAIGSALFNVNAFGGAQVSTLVEAQVLRWTAQLLGLPAHGEGVVVSGSSEANLLALAAARHQALPSAAAEGLSTHPRGRILATPAAHHSVVRAARLLGLGDPHWLAMDECDRARSETIASAIAQLRSRGEIPVAVVMTAGTPGAAAFDPIGAAADVCGRERVWLHVDGAFGAWSRLDPGLAVRAAGLERAHSVAVDFHKALHAPYAAGAVLVRRRNALTEALSVRSNYLAPFRGGIAGLRDWPGERSLSTSRSFSALGVWTCLKGLGRRRLQEEVAASYRRAEALGQRIEKLPGWELVAPVQGPAVLCRPAPAEDRDILRRITRLQQDGQALLTAVRRADGLALRASTLNHRTTSEDLDLLIQALVRAL